MPADYCAQVCPYPQLVMALTMLYLPHLTCSSAPSERMFGSVEWFILMLFKYRFRSNENDPSRGCKLLRENSKLVQKAGEYESMGRSAHGFVQVECEVIALIRRNFAFTSLLSREIPLPRRKQGRRDTTTATTATIDSSAQILIPTSRVGTT